MYSGDLMFSNSLITDQEKMRAKVIRSTVFLRTSRQLFERNTISFVAASRQLSNG